jgi:hypothetical protein
LSEAAKEIKFVLQILKSLGVETELPIIIYVENVGAIFMSENISATSGTRHVDARYHFVREFIVDGVIKIIFVKSAENKSDGFTKKVISELYDSQVLIKLFSRFRLKLYWIKSIISDSWHQILATQEECWRQSPRQ